MARETLYDQQLKRMERLQELGVIHLEKFPNQWQILAASLSYFPEYVSQYGEKEKGVPQKPWLSQMPQRSITLYLLGGYSTFDPTGLTRKKDSLIFHLVSCIHNGQGWSRFDLENLKGMDALDDLISEIKAVLAGTHPRTWLIRNLVGDPTYHPRLLQEAINAKAGIFDEVDPPDRTMQGILEYCLTFPEEPVDILANTGVMRGIVTSPWETLKELGRHTDTAREKLAQLQGQETSVA